MQSIDPIDICRAFYAVALLVSSVVGNDISRIEEGALQNVASTLKVL